MRLGWAGVIVGLYAGAAGAQAPKVSEAPPPDEAGWTVVQLPSGYLRYRTPPEGSAQEAPGSLQIVPAPPAEPASAQAAPPPEPPSEKLAEPGRRRAPKCVPERQLLAQRLVHLRGVDLEPQAAALLWAEMSRPLEPWAYAGIAALGPGSDGTALLNAVSSDQTARARFEALAACLKRR